jgi:hypothetical protein
MCDVGKAVYANLHSKKIVARLMPYW